MKASVLDSSVLDHPGVIATLTFAGIDTLGLVDYPGWVIVTPMVLGHLLTRALIAHDRRRRRAAA